MTDRARLRQSVQTCPRCGERLVTYRAYVRTNRRIGYQNDEPPGWLYWLLFWFTDIPVFVLAGLRWLRDTALALLLFRHTENHARQRARRLHRDSQALVCVNCDWTER